MQNFFTLSDPAMDDGLYQTPCLRSFAWLSLDDAIPDETTFLTFRHLLHGKEERRKASIRTKVEYPFRVIKRQFGMSKVRFKRLVKKTTHVVTLFALSNLWVARKKLMAMMGQICAKRA